MSNKNHKLQNLNLAQAIVIHGLRFLAQSMVLAMVIDIVLLNNTTTELDFCLAKYSVLQTISRAHLTTK